MFQFIPKGLRSGLCVVHLTSSTSVPVLVKDSLNATVYKDILDKCVLPSLRKVWGRTTHGCDCQVSSYLWLYNVFITNTDMQVIQIGFYLYEIFLAEMYHPVSQNVSFFSCR